MEIYISFYLISQDMEPFRKKTKKREPELKDTRHRLALVDLDESSLDTPDSKSTCRGAQEGLSGTRRDYPDLGRNYPESRKRLPDHARTASSRSRTGTRDRQARELVSEHIEKDLPDQPSHTTRQAISTRCRQGVLEIDEACKPVSEHVDKRLPDAPSRPVDDPPLLEVEELSSRSTKPLSHDRATSRTCKPRHRAKPSRPTILLEIE